MNDENQPVDSPPTRVCRKCSVQTQTSGDFCPHCGKTYIARRRAIGRRTVLAIVAMVVLLGGAGTGIVMAEQRDRDEAQAAAAAASMEAQEKADQEAREEAEAKKVAQQARRDAAAAAAEARREAAAARAEAERDERTELIRQMQQSITEDADERVSDGELEGPIFYTTCDPLGGGSVDDLTALTSTFECIAVNEKVGGGQVSGYVFSATANWDKSSWSWQLGS